MYKNLNIKWYLIDAKNKKLGRLISKISIILQGKNKPEYCYNNNIGDYIILINIKYIDFSCVKFNKKIYYKHSGYVGNIKEIKFRDIFNKNTKYIIYNAIKGMLPKNKLRKIMLKKLKIFNYSNYKCNNKLEKIDI